MPKYTQQIVVFLDILGFSNMLPDFETEALDNSNSSESKYHESEKLNKLITIFKDSVDLIKSAECNYYLFSDNICITIDYIDNDTEQPEITVEILTLISLLMKEFVEEGYFLRGGVDAGWFLDSRDIAVGQPLVVAYHLESKIAVYPRVVLSNNFKSILVDYLQKNKLSDYSSFLAEKYLKNDGELIYLNPFFYIVNFEDKEGKIDYLRIYSENIVQKLEAYASDQKVGPKYIWFANEFNEFVDLYVTDNAYLQLDNEELEYSTNELTYIKNLKIKTNAA